VVVDVFVGVLDTQATLAGTSGVVVDVFVGVLDTQATLAGTSGVSKNIKTV
jgi:hypothetical protein